MGKYNCGKKGVGPGDNIYVYGEYIPLLYLACVPGLEPAGAGELLRGGSGLVQVLQEYIGSST